jgi:hypothetical protein
MKFPSLTDNLILENEFTSPQDVCQQTKGAKGKSENRRKG